MDVNMFYNGIQKTNGRDQNTASAPVPKTSWIGRLLAGQTINVQSNGITGNLNTDPAQNYITIKRIGN